MRKKKGLNNERKKVIEEHSGAYLKTKNATTIKNPVKYEQPLILYYL